MNYIYICISTTETKSTLTLYQYNIETLNLTISKAHSCTNLPNKCGCIHLTSQYLVDQSTSPTLLPPLVTHVLQHRVDSLTQVLVLHRPVVALK